MNLEKLDKLRRAVESDRKVSDGACRLFLQILNLHGGNGESFELSHNAAGQLVGITDKATIYARLKQLSPKYLRRVSVRGCPPTATYKIKL